MKKKIVILGLTASLTIGASIATALIVSNFNSNDVKGTDYNTIIINPGDVTTSETPTSGSFIVKTHENKNPVTFNFENIKYVEEAGVPKLVFGEDSYIANDKDWMVRSMYSFTVAGDGTTFDVQYGYEASTTGPVYTGNAVGAASGTEIAFVDAEPNYFWMGYKESEFKVTSIVLSFNKDCVIGTSPLEIIDDIIYCRVNGDHYEVRGPLGSCPANVVLQNEIKGLPVTEIDDYAFYYKDTLESITFGSNLERINSYAFESCSNLTSVSGLQYVKVFEYGSFEACRSWNEDIVFTSSLESISAAAFGSSAIRSVTFADEGNPYVASAAFRWMGELESFHIGSEMIDFHDDLDYNPKLATITVGEGNTHYKAVENVLYSRYSSTWYVTRIAQNRAETSFTLPDDAFLTSYCGFGATTLKTLVLSDNENRVPDYAFSHCESLTSITFGNHENFEIGYSFYNCTALEEILIPSNVKSIAQCAFEECKALRTVIFENGCTKLDNQVFLNCTSLEKVLLPTTLVDVGNGTSWTGKPDDVFDGCTKLRRVLTRLEDGESYDETQFATNWLGGRSLLTHSDTIHDRDHWRMVDDVPQAWSTDITFIVERDAGYGNSFYIFGSFNEWAYSEDYIMNYADGKWTFSIELPTCVTYEFKAYCAPTGDCTNAFSWEKNNHSWTIDDTAYEYVCNDW